VERITNAVEKEPAFAGATCWSLSTPRVKIVVNRGDDISIDPVMASVPQTAEELAALRVRALGDELWAGSLVARDGSSAAVIVDIPAERIIADFNVRLDAILAPERDAETTIVTAGGPVILGYLDDYTRQMAWLFPIAVGIIAIVHYEALRTAQAMVLPLVTALLSVVSALGIMGWLGYGIDTWSAVTPVAILAIAAGHSVQILKRYYEELAVHGNRRQAVVTSLARTGPTTATATLIAAGGFASLASFDVVSIRVFGAMMACGIMSALVIELTLIPAWRVLFRTGAPGSRSHAPRRLQRALAPATHLVLEHPRRVVVAAAVLIAVCLVGAARIRVDGSLRSLFPPDSRLRRDEALINARFAGTSTFAVLVEGDRDAAATAPDVLRAMADMQEWLRRFPEVGKTASIADHVWRLHAVMDPSAAAAERIPENARLVAQYLFLSSLSGSDDLRSLVTPDGRSAVVAAYVRSDEASFAARLISETDAYARTRFAGLPVRVGVAGGTIGAQAALNEVIVREKVRNGVQVAAIILVLSAFALRSLVGGLCVLVPLVVASAVTLAAMGWSNTWLTMSTAATLAMGVSIGADFALYLLFRVREEMKHDGVQQSVARALETSGAAIFYVSSAVALGYSVLLFSDFSPWIHLGGIMALLSVVSAVASVTVLPALILVIEPAFLRSPI